MILLLKGNIDVIGSNAMDDLVIVWLKLEIKISWDSFSPEKGSWTKVKVFPKDERYLNYKIL